MSWEEGVLRQPFRIEVDVDIDMLMEHITDDILGRLSDNKEIDSVEFSDYYMSDSKVIINGSYTADFRENIIPATRLDPPDYDIQRPHIYEKEIYEGLPEWLRKLIEISDVIEYEEWEKL